MSTGSVSKIASTSFSILVGDGLSYWLDPLPKSLYSFAGVYKVPSKRGTSERLGE
ncbi:MAG: hypothetical protein QXW12_02860 [Nitrososphaerota archaeon]